MFGSGACMAAAEKLRLQLKWYHQFQFAGYYAAQSKGFYRDENLDVDLIEGARDRPVDRMVLEGKAEFGIQDGGDLIFHRLLGDPLVAVAVIFQHSPYVIASVSSSGIRHPSDLVGRTVLASRNQGEAPVLAMFRREGIKVNNTSDQEPVHFAPHTWDFADVVAGRADAMSAYITEIPRIERQFGLTPAILNPLDYGIDFYGDTLFTSSRYLKEKPDVVARFRRASLKGWQYAMAHAGEIADVILTMPSAREQKPDRQALLDEAERMNQIILPTLVELGNINPGRWLQMAKVFQELEVVASIADLDTFSYSEDAGKQEIRDKLQLVGIVLASITLLAIAGLFWLRQLRTRVALRTRELSSEIGERVKVEVQLRESEFFLRQGQQIGQMGGWRADPVLNTVMWTEGVYTIAEMPFDFKPDLEAALDFYLPRSRERVVQSMNHTLQTGEPFSIQVEVRGAQSGKNKWTELRGFPHYASDGSMDYVMGTLQDISERRLAEEALRLSEERYRATFQASLDIITLSQLSDGKYIDVNQAFLDLFGYQRNEVIDHTALELNVWENPSDRQHFVEILQRHSSSRDREARFRKRNGEVFWGLISVVLIEIDKVTCALFVIKDITERKLAEEKINELAFFDPLTSLPNRTLLLDRLKQHMTLSSRSGQYGALLLIDLDNFKALNDTLGHDMGDVLLRQVAQRLSDCVRAEDTVARLGGDEFVVILTSLSATQRDAAAQTELVGEKIIASLTHPYQLKDVTYHSTPSIGVSLFVGQETDIDGLIKQADIAMYRSKKEGGNALRFFDSEMESVVMKRATLENDLRTAIQDKQFVLYYQAQVSSGGQLVGAEALVRWQDPLRGLVSPGEFIPLAEDTGLILPLGHWVLEAACNQLAAWAKQPEMASLTIAVNVSARQLRQKEFVEQVLTILKHTNANPQRLKLELTESMLLSNVADVIEKMLALKAYGVGFSLDDFGTGYSSLSYLKRLPLDQLKIDQSFVQDVLSDPDDASIAKTVIALAQNLGLNVIAEGVETEAQRDYLYNAGCSTYQGYFFGRPLPIEDFERVAQRGMS